MTNSDPNKKAPDHKTAALLALALDRPAPEGPRPSLLEIDLYRRNKLSRKRRKEVKTYIARDPECYQMWHDLWESEIELDALRAPKTPGKPFRQQVYEFLQHHLYASGGLAVAMTLLIAVLGYQHFLSPSIIGGIDDDYYRYDSHPFASGWTYRQSTDKGLDFALPTPYDQARQNILAGLHKGLTTLLDNGKLDESWRPIAGRYPDQTQGCQPADDRVCLQRNRDLSDFGYWLALMRMDCIRPDRTVETGYLEQQRERQRYFSRRLSNYPVLSPLTERLRSQLENTDPQTFCQSIADLLNEVDH